MTKIGRPEDMFFETERYCDGCTTKLEDGEYVATYFSDTKWGGPIEGKMPAIAVRESYCLNCYNDRIPLPRIGTREGFTFETLRYHEDEDAYKFHEERVMRYSGETDGIDWNPPSIYENLLEFDIQKLSHEITPMSAYIEAHNLGIDLRGFIDGNKLKIPDSAMDTAHEIIRQNVDYQQKYSFDSEML